MSWKRACLLLLAFAAPVVGGQASVSTLPAAHAEWARQALLGGMEAPLGTRLLLLLLAAAPLAAAFARPGVVSLPRLDWLAAAALLVGASALPALGTEYRWAFVEAWPTVVLPVVAALAATAVLGRREGPLAVLDALVAGAAAVAVRGILEYAAVRASEPGYRIFAGQNNPNVAASVLAAALPLAAVRAASAGRVRGLALAAAAALTGLALALTQSKGGLLAAAAGLGVAAALLAAGAGRRRLLLPFAAVVCAAGLLGFAALRAPQGEPGAPAARLLESKATSVQSEGYRRLLWQTSLRLAAERPLGWGAGSFPAASSRPGIVPPTFNSHQAWLQAACEGGWASLLGLAAVFVLGARRVGSGMRHLPLDRQAAACGVLGLLAAVAAHGLVESNLAFAGIAAITGLALGAGFAVSNDGAASEPLPTAARAAAALYFLAPAALLALLAANSERAKAAALADGPELARSAPAASFGADGEAWAIAAAQGGGAPDWERSARAHPTPRAYRALARLARQAGRPEQAERHLRAALRLDPNNLPALWQLAEVLGETGNRQEQLRVARQLVAVEEKPYFRVRAIPELVPTETYDARVLLARAEPDAAEKERLLKGAVEGYLEYLAKTLPLARRFAAARLDFLGQSLDDAQAVQQKARDALADYRSLPLADPVWASEASRAVESADFSPLK